MQLGRPKTELRRKLVEAVLSGHKTATASLRDGYAPYMQERLPRAGDRSVLTGFHDEPTAIIQTTSVEQIRVADVSLAFAQDEGEGFETVADWRQAHERFWDGRDITDDTIIVAERFAVIQRL